MIRQIYRGRILDVRLEGVRLPNGSDVELEIIRHIGAAAVVPVDDQVTICGASICQALGLRHNSVESEIGRAHV